MSLSGWFVKKFFYNSGFMPLPSAAAHLEIKPPG